MSDVTTPRKVLKNVLHGFSTWILPLSLSFIVTPVLVRSFGKVEYGIYALILAFIAYSFNFNIGRAATRYIADYRASGRMDEIGKIVSATMILNIAVGAVGLTSIYLLSEWLIVDVFFIEPELTSLATASLRLTGLIIFLMMLTQVFLAVIQGFHRFDIYARIQNFTSIFTLAGNMILALNGYGIIELLYWNILVLSATCILAFLFCMPLLSGIRSFALSTASLKLVTYYSIGVIGYQISANIFLLFERGWITSHFGSTELTYYVVPMSLAILLLGFILSMTMVVFPTVSEIGRDTDRLLELYLIANKFVSFIIVLPAFFLIVWRTEVLSIWVGSDFGERSAIFLILHILTFSFSALYVVSSQIAEGLGHTRFNFLSMLAGLIFAVPLMILVSSHGGTNAIAAVRTTAFFLILLNYIYFERFLFGKIQFHFWLRNLSYLLIAAGISSGVTFLIRQFFELSWFLLAAMIVASGFLYLTILWISGFINEREKDQLLAIYHKR